MPKSHPIRRRCPISLSPNHWYDLDLAPDDRRWRNWNDTSSSNKPFSTQLIGILSCLREWIGHGSDIEQCSLEECPPWAETLIQTRISLETKENEAKANVRQADLLTKRPRNLLTYTDGSMLDNKVGAAAGVYINPNGNQLASEKTYP